MSIGESIKAYIASGSAQQKAYSFADSFINLFLGHPLFWGIVVIALLIFIALIVKQIFYNADGKLEGLVFDFAIHGTIIIAVIVLLTLMKSADRLMYYKGLIGL
jgi:hypothetical protein